MLNRSFYAAKKSEKIDKIKQVLKSKNPKLNTEQLNLIIKHIDIEKQHYIKFTNKTRKFENIVTDEFISTDNNQLISRSIPIYGNFNIGSFININDNVLHIESKVDSSCPSAALKTVAERIKNSTKTTMILVIYHP